MSSNFTSKQIINASTIACTSLSLFILTILFCFGYGIFDVSISIKSFHSSNIDPNPITNITKIMIQRVTIPPKCNNSSHHLLHINPINHNWAPYYFRCAYHSQEHTKQPWSSEAFVSKQLFYDHVFKSGGSTIQNSLVQLIKNGTLFKLTPISDHYVLSGGDIAQYSNHKNPKYAQNTILKFMDNNATLFSFVRDPLDKFLSAFYEAHVRMFKMHEIDINNIPMINKYNELSGIEIMRIWIDVILVNMADQYLSEFERKRKAIQKHKLRHEKHKQIPFIMHKPKVSVNRKVRIKGGSLRRRLGVDYINSHLPPNMVFLLGNDYNSSVPFNFIGNLKNFNNDFPQILEPFIVDEKYKRNGSALMELVRVYNSRQEEIDVMLMKFNIDKNALSDKDIEKICEIYWLDYLCLPFDIPVQCKLEQLIKKYYGKHVEYKECY